MGKPHRHAWFCFHPGCKTWAQTEEAIESHVHAGHGVGKDEVRRREHYGTGDEKALYDRNRETDIEDACRGFAKWLKSVNGADDFLYETGGL